MRTDRRTFLKAAGATIGASLSARRPASRVRPGQRHQGSRHPRPLGGLDIYGRPMVDCLNFAVEEINRRRRTAGEAAEAHQLRRPVQHPALYAVRHRGRHQGARGSRARRHHLGVT